MRLALSWREKWAPVERFARSWIEKLTPIKRSARPWLVKVTPLVRFAWSWLEKLIPIVQNRYFLKKGRAGKTNKRAFARPKQVLVIFDLKLARLGASFDRPAKI